MRTLVSRAIMQLLSCGQTPVREELHTRDAGPESSNRGLAVASHVIDGLDNQTHALPLPKAQLTGGFQDALRVDGLGDLCHDDVSPKDYDGLPLNTNSG